MRSPTIHDSHWRPVRLLMQSIDAQIAALYDERGIEGVPPRYSIVLITLRAGERTIKDLAVEAEVTHSAMSQTVAAMRRDGLVRTVAGSSVPGGDARTRLVALTDRGRNLVPFLEAEWWATEAVVAQLDAEVGGGLRAAAARVAAVLAARPFAERVRAHLEEGAPMRGAAGPGDGGAYPGDGGAYPGDGGAHPDDGGAYPGDGGAYPGDGGAHPDRGDRP